MSTFIPNNERYALRFINGAYVVLDRVKFQNVAGPFHTIAEARKDAQRNGVQLVMRPALSELETEFNEFSSELRWGWRVTDPTNSGAAVFGTVTGRFCASHATR